VELSEQLDVQRQRQHRPRALAEHGVSDSVGVDIKAIAVRQNLADHRVDATEKGLVLQLLVAKPNQRLERNLVTEPVIVAQLQHLGVDEALDQPENIGVGAALDLTDEPLFVGRQSRELSDKGKPVRQKLVGSVEAAAPDHILFDVPAHPLGRLNTTCISFAVGRSNDHIHCASPLTECCADRTSRLMRHL
jgi:hypothetical protein